MCDPILVTLIKMRPHYSQSVREKNGLSLGLVQSSPAMLLSPNLFHTQEPVPEAKDLVFTLEAIRSYYRPGKLREITKCLLTQFS